MRSLIASLCLVLFAGSAVKAQPQGPQPWWPTQPRDLPLLHPLFSNDAVLQREIAAPIWGWTKPGEQVRLTLDGKPIGEATAAADGRWQAKLPAARAGGPHEIAVQAGARTETIRNILFGDVWLCSGQSNMNWPVRLSQNAEEEIKQANDPELRSFTVDFYASLVPMKVPPRAKWEVCKPETAKNFTGVGYFFAKQIRTTRKIPVGIIHASVGATAAEAWVSGDALNKKMPFDFPDRLTDLQKQVDSLGGVDTDYFQALEKWVATIDPASAKKHYASDPNLDTSDWQDLEVPKPWQEAGLKDHNGLVWFRHTIEIPEAWKGRDLSLVLSIIKEVDLVWFNGTLIGSKPISGVRTYHVDANLVKPGRNLFVAAIYCKEGPGGFCSGPSNMIVKPEGIPNAQLRLTGTWKAKASAKASEITQPAPLPLVGHYKTITTFYNGMIAPLIPFGIKGALWYQGEANGPFWLQYRRLLPTLIEDWRSRFGVGDFPFLIVSLANLNSLQTRPLEPGWAELRESQWRTVRTVPNTGLAMTIDIGDPGNIHPKNKQEVGRRLSLVARNLVYGEKDLLYSGPEFKEMQIELPKGDKIRLYFKHLGGGLTIKPGDTKLLGFAIAGEDRQFVWGDAVIEGDTIVVASPGVPYPKYVRYGWAWNPIGNLYNKAGLPAITFRTDE